MRLAAGLLVASALTQGAVAAESATATYAQYCAVCHGANLEGGEAGPALRGRAFVGKWTGKPVAELYEFTRRTMPVTQPGGLTRSQYSDLVALVLTRNELPTGDLAKAVAAAAVLPDTEWLQHRGDAGSTNYSPLDQIDAGNVSQLKVAWRWRSDNFGPAIWPNLEVTPLMANGVLYATAGASRSVVAIDARNGETLWVYRLDEGTRGSIAPRKGPGRGLALWRDNGRDTLYVISPGYQLLALDAKSGRPVRILRHLRHRRPQGGAQ